MDRSRAARERDLVTVRSRGAAEFVGRDRELQVVTDLLQGRRPERRGRGMVIEGEAGIGKSRLVAEALARAPEVRVLHGGADPFGRHRSVGAVTSALGELDPEGSEADARLVALLGDPRAGRAVGPGLGSQLVDACVAAVVERARAGRVALVLEDLQWADDGTAAVVGELCEAVPGRDVVVVATRRRTPRPETMRRLEAEHSPRVEVLDLAPLGDAAVVELVADLLGRPPTPDLVSHVARASGNPLYVTELVDALAEQGSLVVDGGRDSPVEVHRTSLPPNLRVTLLRRLSTLPADALDALRVAALLGTSFLVEDVAIGLDEPVPRTVARLEEPLRAGWLRGDGDRLRFRHDLVRDALHDDVPAAIRRGLHRHLADRLAVAGRGAQEVAQHLVLGASPPDAEAAAWLHAAGAAASSREPAVAVELLEAAARLHPTPGPAEDALRLDLAVASCWSGRVADGEAMLRELLGRPHDPAIDAEAALALARSLILGGGTEEALHVLAAAEERSASDRDRARLCAERAICAMLRGELRAAFDAATQILAATDISDESRCVAHAVRAALLALEGRVPEAIASGRRAVEVAARSAERETVRRPPQLFLGSLLLDADRFDEGWRLLDEGRRASEALGSVWDLPVVHLVTARGRYLTGAHDDSLAEVETALGLADEVGTHVLEVWGHAIAAHVHLHRSDVDRVRAALAAGEAVIEQVGPQVRGVDWLVWARAGLAQLEGEDDVARQLLMAVWEGHRERGMRSERRLLGPELARLHLRLGDETAAGTVAAAVEELAELAGTVSSAAAALHVRGLVERDADRLVAAATATQDSGCRTEHVGQALDAADRLLAEGRDAEAAVWFQRGSAVARGAGMTRSVRRADAGLRGLGVRSGVRGQRGRPRTGWAALTPTERTVTDLAARGLSNPEIGQELFISRRTVQTHLSHVYAKLGVTSRVELATQVAQRAR